MMLFLLHLAGAAALLIWSVRLIRTGVERAFLPQLRLALRRSERSRVLTAGSGLLAAILLQSSTAVALIVAGFTISGGLAAAGGLAILLGADLGSAIAAQILLVRADWIEPLLFLAGTLMFLRARRRAVRQTGRVLIGLALVFVSLDMIQLATEPLKDSPVVATLVGYLEGDAVSAFVIGGVLAYAVHSSLAAVLMFVTFVAAGVLSVSAGAAMVLGANLGGAMIPVILTLSMPVAARRVVMSNLVLRGGGAILLLAALVFLQPDLSPLGAAEYRQVINFHLAFNAVLLVLGLPLTGMVTRAVGGALRDGTGGDLTAPIPALDQGALDQPERALAAAGRETLRMAERVAAMLVPALALYREWDDDVADAIRLAEDDVDRMHFQSKLFLARLQERDLSEDQRRRAMDLVSVANNLEDAGDRISTDLMGMARRMRTEGLSFSKDGWRDLEDFHDLVVANAQLALDVLMSDDADVARQLLEQKDRVRQIERDLQERHLERLRQGGSETLETSNLHQETIRALKLVNTALCFIAYPIAEEAGDLLSSRIARPQADAPPKDRPRRKRKAEA